MWAILTKEEWQEDEDVSLDNHDPSSMRCFTQDFGMGLPSGRFADGDCSKSSVAKRYHKRAVGSLKTPNL